MSKSEPLNLGMIFFKNVGLLRSSGLLNQVSLEEISLSNACFDAAELQDATNRVTEGGREKREKNLSQPALCRGGRSSL